MMGRGDEEDGDIVIVLFLPSPHRLPWGCSRNQLCALLERVWGQDMNVMLRKGVGRP